MVKGRLSRVVAVLVSIAVWFVMFLGIDVSMNTVQENASITASAAGMTLEQLKSKFPHGTYWNHAGSSTNNPDGYTNSPCTHHGNCSKGDTDYSGWCGCNSFSSSIQCMGFANKLAYDAFGSSASSWPSVSNMNSVKPGDVIRYKNNGHSIFVTGVNGDIITYADCNSDGHCKIMWDKTISKSDIWGFNYVKSAPSQLSVSPSNNMPIGVVDEVSGGAGTVSVGGWGFDPDNMGVSIDVHVYLRDSLGNMIGVGTARADGYRDDVNRVHGCGDYHGFSTILPTELTGNYHVMVALIDATDEGATWCDGGDVTITASDTISPIVTNAEVINVTSDGYTVRCKASDNVGIADVNVATWSENLGQDVDCQWNSMIKSGDYYVYTVKFSDHQNQKGTYQNHIYANDLAENRGFASAPYVPEMTVPIVKNVYISDLSNTGYTVHCTASDNIGVVKVEFPTWTEKNDQDDIIWGEGIQSGDEYTYRVNIKDHNGEVGTYFTHIYAYDAAGNFGTGGVGVVIQNDTVKPVISNVTISNVSSTGYTVSCTVDDNVGISRVMFPTWTTSEGQDDIIWGFGTQNGSTYTYRVNISDHNGEKGKYATHIYAYDYANNDAVYYLEIIPQDFYKVTFNANDGACDKTSMNISYGSKYGVLPTPTKSGYTFMGWFTSKTDGTKVTADSKYSATENQTLYAQWKVTTYVVTLNPNGGTCDKEGISVTYDGKYGTFPTPTRSGYKFEGWYTSKTGGTKITSETRVSITANQTLYAHWTAESFKGDVDKDSKVAVLDAVMLQKYILNAGSVTDWQAGDLNNDGILDIFDLALLKRMLIENK